MLFLGFFGHNYQEVWSMIYVYKFIFKLLVGWDACNSEEDEPSEQTESRFSCDFSKDVTNIAPNSCVTTIIKLNVG